MRLFNSIIFMGSGDHSLKQVQTLIKRVNAGVNLLSALQQPDHPESPEHAVMLKSQRVDGEKELNDIVKDIVMAFTGKEFIIFGDSDFKFSNASVGQLGRVTTFRT